MASVSSIELTRGSIAAITEEKAGEDLKPVLQVWDVRLVNTQQSTQERYRVLLSDGILTQQAMLATQMNGLVKSGELQKHSVVKLNEFICNEIQGRRIIIVIGLEVLSSKCDPIGDPKLYDNMALQSRTSAPARSTATGQPGLVVANNQTLGNSHSGGPFVGQNVGGGVSLQAKSESMASNSHYGSSYASGPLSGRNLGSSNNLQPKVDHAPSSFGDAHQNVNQNQRFSGPGSTAGFRPPTGSYGRPAQPAYQQPPPLYANRGPIAKNEAPARIIPISALNPYQGRWTIKAKVTAKGELRRYNNPRGEGKVFSFDLLDSECGEIRATCFNMVADQFYDQIVIGKVYIISKGSLKPAQKNFNHLNNDYEIFLESSSMVQLCPEETDTIPNQNFIFRQINEIETMDNNSMVDLIGIVASINPSATIMRKNGTETHKRTLQLKDMSGRSVEVTLWGNFCNNEGAELQRMCDSGLFPVLAIKAGRVSDFSGKSVGTITSSQLFINPDDVKETNKLMEWFAREGKNVASTSISRDSSTIGRNDVRKSVAQIKDEGLGRGEKPDWITVKATVTFIKVDNFCYTACPLTVGDRQCNKKVTNNGDGSWHCDRCDQTFPECDYRYLLQFQIQDHTGMTWVTAFQECGEDIMGITAKELYLMKYEEQDDVKFSENIRRVLFNQYLFKLKIKEETFSDEQRVKSTVVKADKVNPSSESKFLLGLIEKISQDDLGTNAPGVGMSTAGYSTVDGNQNSMSGMNNYAGNMGSHQSRIEPANQLGQQGNMYGGNMNYSLGAREQAHICNICGSSGHSFQNCPMAANRQGQSAGGYANRSQSTAADGGNGTGTCYKCQQPGHWARDCPGKRASTPVYGGTGVSGRYATNVRGF